MKSTKTSTPIPPPRPDIDRPPVLAILVSKQVDLIIDHGGETSTESKFILAIYAAIEKAIKSKEWDAIRTNSVTIAAAFDLPYPGDNDYDPVELCDHLWKCSNVVAFWAGGPTFQSVLESTVNMRRKLRLYVCSTKKLSVELIPTTEAFYKPT